MNYNLVIETLNKIKDYTSMFVYDGNDADAVYNLLGGIRVGLNITGNLAMPGFRKYEERAIKNLGMEPASVPQYYMLRGKLPDFLVIKVMIEIEKEMYRLYAEDTGSVV